MAQQQGYIFKHRGAWYLRYRDNFVVDAKIVRKQKCVRLADVCDRYRIASDLDDLVAEKMGSVRQAAKCPHSADLFNDYVEQTYLPYVLRTMKPSTYAAYRTYAERYILPRTAKFALRDFTTATVSDLLEDVAAVHKLNSDTVTKVRSILSGIFTYAIGKGHFPARSAADNPASRALIPDTAAEPRSTVAASRADVTAYLTALKANPLARAAVALIALTGVRPGEARGLRWKEWYRDEQQIAVSRSVWHRIIGTPKTEQSEGFVTVTDELRQLLLELWEAQDSPIDGYILAGSRDEKPAILDNVSKRVIVPAIETRCATCGDLEKDHEGGDHAFEKCPAWKGWYALRRFHGTAVRKQAKNSETAAKALRNSKEVFEEHYHKPTGVLPEVRQAVNDAMSGILKTATK